MRLYLIIFFAFIFQYSTNAQVQFPKIGTTKDAAFGAIARGESDERWFETQENGFKIYGKVFKNTTIGIRHAFDEFEKIKKEYRLSNCKDKSIIANMAKDSKDNINFELLPTSIMLEQSEILMGCESEEQGVSQIILFSVFNGSTSFLSLRIETTVKAN